MENLIIGVAVGAAYSLMAVGVVLIYKCTRALSIAQGEIGAFAFFYGLLAAKGELKVGIPFTPIGVVMPKVPIFFALVIAVVLGAGLALLLERTVMRALVTRPPLDGLIATLGAALLLALLELKIFGTATQNAPSPVGDKALTDFLPFLPKAFQVLTAPRLVALGLAVVAAAGTYVFFNRTKFGLAVLATTSDPAVAKVLGVPVNRVYQFAWVTAGALSGLAAALLSPVFGGLTPFAQTQFALKALAGAVIGGLDSVEGAILGSIVVGVLETLVKSRTYGDFAPNGVAQLAVLVLVLGTLVARPQGFLGTASAV